MEDLWTWLLIGLGMFGLMSLGAVVGMWAVFLVQSGGDCVPVTQDELTVDALVPRIPLSEQVVSIEPASPSATTEVAAPTTIACPRPSATFTLYTDELDEDAPTKRMEMFAWP